jgi:hypothetical protein
MMRAAIHKGIEHSGTVLVCLLIGSLAARIAKYFGAPMEIALPVFALTTVSALAIWYLSEASE